MTFKFNNQFNKPLRIAKWVDLNKLEWKSICHNIPKNALNWLVTNHKDKIDWQSLSYNPEAIELLEKNLDKISWYGLNVYKFSRLFRKKS